MPLPSPSPGESQDEFISRCMSDNKAIEEFPDNDQRLAVCLTQFERGGTTTAADIKERPMYPIGTRVVPIDPHMPGHEAGGMISEIRDNAVAYGIDFPHEPGHKWYLEEELSLLMPQNQNKKTDGKGLIPVETVEEVQNVKHGRGPQGPKIAFVGGSYSDIDHVRKEAFTGPCGATLRDEYLEPLGLTRDDIYLANVVPKRLKNEIGALREPTEEESARYRDSLRSELESVSPRIVVALGLKAKNALGEYHDYYLPHPNVIRKNGDIHGELERKLRLIRRDLANMESNVVTKYRSDIKKQPIPGFSEQLEDLPNEAIDAIFGQLRGLWTRWPLPMWENLGVSLLQSMRAREMDTPDPEDPFVAAIDILEPQANNPGKKKLA